MRYSLSEIASIVGGKHIGADHVVEHVCTDSRTLARTNSVFIALNGPNFSGEDFVQDACAQGIVSFISNTAVNEDGTGTVVVNDTLNALQKLAAHHRAQFNIPVIGITGSAGKTIVKEWLYTVLKPNYNICRSPKSYNSQLGVALSVLQLREDHELAIFEAGISKPNEMEILEQMIQPTAGILTSIGTAHISNFDGQEHIALEKEKLFKSCKWVVRPNDESSEAFDVPFKDQASVANCKSVAETALKLGLDRQLIEERLSELTPVALRLEVREGINDCLILNDSYNSDVSGLFIALDHLKKLGKEKTTVVLSDIELDTVDQDMVYSNVFSRLKELQVNRVITVGAIISQHAEKAGLYRLTTYTSTDALLDAIIHNDFSNESILIKGARSFGFERVSSRLEKKPHATWLEVNLDNMISNLNHYRSKVGDSGIMVMIKALAYGAGGTDIARELARHNVDYFGVAYASEAIPLREEGIDLPVMVLNADANTFATIVEFGLEPVVYDMRQLDEFVSYLIRQGISGYPVHIELDTGMRRLGFEIGELKELVEYINSQPEVRVQSVFTHLSVADDSSRDDFTNGQIEIFEKGATYLRERLGYEFFEHVCNTSGIERFPHAHKDMVRLGIGLHGVNSDQANVASLYTTVSQVKHVRKGEAIGYGMSAIAEDDLTIAIVPIGYADGLTRDMSNGVGYLHHETTAKNFPIIGKVCMDMTMIKVDDSVSSGDRMEIFGENISLQEIADLRGTIPYEVLTSVSSRVKRVYVSGS